MDKMAEKILEELEVVARKMDVILGECKNFSGFTGGRVALIQEFIRGYVELRLKRPPIREDGYGVSVV